MTVREPVNEATAALRVIRDIFERSIGFSYAGKAIIYFTAGALAGTLM